MQACWAFANQTIQTCWGLTWCLQAYWELLIKNIMGFLFVLIPYVQYNDPVGVGVINFRFAFAFERLY